MKARVESGKHVHRASTAVRSMPDPELDKYLLRNEPSALIFWSLILLFCGFGETYHGCNVLC
jgi:hypothetical protein